MPNYQEDHDYNQSSLSSILREPHDAPRTIFFRFYCILTFWSLLFPLLSDVKDDYVHQDESHDEVDKLGDYFDENL
jgi:hypothetical protein